jgi:outer membrane protein assembly factor BamB
MIGKASMAALVAFVTLVTAAPAGPPAQSAIALPDEFRPEGIASGAGSSFYVGSIPHGAVFRGSYRTGEGDVLVPPHPGRNHTGMKVDLRSGLLFVAGGASKGIYVYDAETGADVASFSLPDAGFVNDVVLTRTAAYFTDSNVQQLYRVEIGRHGAVGEPTRIPITGDLQYGAGFNANGIEATRDGRTLIVVQSSTGKLFAVDARTGASREIALNTPVTNGDGLLLRGCTLLVVQNQDNKVAEVKLGQSLKRGEVVRHISSPDFDVPTTLAPFKGFVFAVNARFDRPDDSDADVVRLPR